MKLQIKEYREELGFTQKELAEKIGSLQRNISNWENGINEPDCETIMRLADIFDITIDELFGRISSARSEEPISGFEMSILKITRKLTKEQQFTLLQFLKEMKNA